MRGTVFIIADTPEIAGAEADRLGLNREETRRATYMAADGSTAGHSLMIRRPATYINLTGRALHPEVALVMEWLSVEEE